jgi:hypothetical protein
MTVQSRPPYCVAAPVWGDTHVQRWLTCVLPSWLAPGNLPALGARRPVLIQIATRAADVAVITSSPLFALLKSHTRVEFVMMDDLIGPAAMSVTLTLSYQRVIRAAAEDGRTATVILLNADFVLADGSLAAMADALDAGARCILAPSLRATEEDVRAALIGGRDAEGRLSLQPRALVQLALAATHPTALFSRIDQQAVHSTNPNQLFWRADADTLIGRPFCLFVLALVVDGPVGPAETFCDYGLAPLLAPTEAPLIMNDSDRFFALELTPLNKEQDFLALGVAGAPAIAERISTWSMQFHRDQARTAMFYRTGDGGPDVDAVVLASQRYVDALLAAMGPPRPIRNHHHWLGAVALWRTARENRGVREDPPELAPTADVRIAAESPSINPVRRLARSLLVGWPGRHGPQHPGWSLAAAIRRRIDDARRRGMATAFVGERMSFQCFRLDDLDGEAPDAVFVACDLDYADALALVVARAREAAPDASEATLICFSSSAQPIETSAVARLLSHIDGWLDLKASVAFDLRVDEAVRLTHGRLADGFERASAARRLALAGASALAMLRMFAVNCARLARAGRTPKLVSTVLIDAAARPRQDLTGSE